MSAALPQIVLKKPPTGSLRFGHPWVYRDQVLQTPEGLAPGGLADLMTTGGRFMGRGYWNPKSEITFRILTFADEAIDAAFFERRLKAAGALRKRWVKETNSWRVVSAEADGLPGLIVDRYGEVLVAQFLALGMDGLKPLVLDALDAVEPSRGVYERADASSRKLEGLGDRSGWVRRECGGDIEIVERDVRFSMRPGEGHKTGFYLDQRENRLWLRDAALGKRALDVFCYEGSFALHLARAGMRVTGIDSQADVLKRAAAHRERNGIAASQLDFVEANAFDELKRLEKAGEKADLVILDPPSFVNPPKRSADSSSAASRPRRKREDIIDSAVAGYKELCLRAMKILEDGGHLALFSCSFHIDENRLMQAALGAARDAGRALRVVRFFKQSADHPIDPFVPETYYLKGYLFQSTVR